MDFSNLIDNIVDNLGETKELKLDLATTNLTYVIFVSFVTILIAPLLFALSSQFLIVLTSFSENMGSMATHSTVAMPLTVGEIAIDCKDFEIFARYVIGTTAFFSSMIVSLINRGSIKECFRYIPFFIAFSLLLHKIFMILFTTIFGQLFSF